MRFLVCILLFCQVLLPAAQVAGKVAKPAGVHSIQADFTQEKHLKILVRPLISEGRFVFEAPDSLRWEYYKPVHSILLMHEGKMRKFIESDGRLLQDNAMNAGSMQFILPEICNWLDGRFTDNPIFTSQKLDDRTIVLIPKEKGLRAVIRRIELHLGDTAGTMESVTIVEGPDSSTVLRFSNIVLNGRIPEQSFSLR